MDPLASRQFTDSPLPAEETVARPAPSKAELQRRVSELGAIQPWNHNFRLPYGVETSPGWQTSQGKNLVKWSRLRSPLELIGAAGKRILDVGCGEGFFSFRLAEMGGDVFGIDIDKNRIAKAEFIRSVLNPGRVRFQDMGIYSEDFLLLPRFDLCLCLGFLHRVPDPFIAISRLAGKANLLLLEWKVLKFGPHDEPFAYFSARRDDAADSFSKQYWLLSYAAVEAMLDCLGFGFFHRIDDPKQRRAILVAGKIDNPIFHIPDVIHHRGRVRALLSHTKRYILTVAKVLSGRINS